jgi:hypothetical protein
MEDGASATDEDSLKKAMHLQANRNLDFSQGISSHRSYLSFSSERVNSNMRSLGFGLGNSDKEVVLSVKALKRVEFDRLKVSPKLSCNSTEPEPSDDEHDMAHDGHLLSHIVGSVSEVGLDEHRFDHYCDLTSTARKSKSQSNKRNSKKPSKRARTSKSPNVSS